MPAKTIYDVNILAIVITSTKQLVHYGNECNRLVITCDSNLASITSRSLYKTNQLQYCSYIFAVCKINWMLKQHVNINEVRLTTLRNRVVRGGRSGIRSDSDRIFRIFGYFGIGIENPFGYFCTSGRVRIFLVRVRLFRIGFGYLDFEIKN